MLSPTFPSRLPRPRPTRLAMGIAEQARAVRPGQTHVVMQVGDKARSCHLGYAGRIKIESRVRLLPVPPWPLLLVARHVCPRQKGTTATSYPTLLCNDGGPGKCQRHCCRECGPWRPPIPLCISLAVCPGEDVMGPAKPPVVPSPLSASPRSTPARSCGQRSLAMEGALEMHVWAAFLPYTDKGGVQATTHNKDLQ